MDMASATIAPTGASIGHGSNSSSSMSSNSSGYGSATTTPTNYESQSTTPVAVAEPIPVATVAAVTPFFNETIAMSSLEMQQQQQHQHHHHQQQQLHMQQQQQLQQQVQHQRQQQPQHSQPQQLQSQQQQRQQQQQQQQQQYFHSYDYASAMAPAPHATNTLPHYSATASYEGAAYAGGHYRSAAANYERNVAMRPTVASAATAAAHPHAYPNDRKSFGSHAQPFEAAPVESKFYKYSHLLNAKTGCNELSTTPTPTTITVVTTTTTATAAAITTTSATTKPQAAATPFYAQPLHHSAAVPDGYYDNYKYKGPPADFQSSYGGSAAISYQQQKYYAAAKSQLQEAPAPYAPLTKSTYPATSPQLHSAAYYSNVGGGGGGGGGGGVEGAGVAAVGSGAYEKYEKYEKYLYGPASATSYPSATHNLTLAPPSSPQLSNDALSEGYRKSSASSTWPWNVDYSAANNSRPLPPPATAGHIPTAAVAPSSANYLTPSANNYYMPPEKYGKYQKYAAAYSPYQQQVYVAPPPPPPQLASGRNLWPGAHGHHHTLQPHAAAHHMSVAHHNAAYYATSGGLNTRQACCASTFQQQSCYFPRLPPPTHHQQQIGVAAGYGPQQPQSSSSSSSCKFNSVTDYAAAAKLKNPNDLYVAAAYDAAGHGPPPHNYNYNYSAAMSPGQLYSSGPHQAVVAPIANGPPLDAAGSGMAGYGSNDLSPSLASCDSFASAPYQQHLALPPTLTPTPTYPPNPAKRALLDYRKPPQSQPQPQPQPQPQRQLQPQLQPQPQPQPPSADRYVTSARDHFQVLLNEHDSCYAAFDATSVGATNGAYLAALADEHLSAAGGAEKATSDSAKNLSLRDFIANWNDDEEDCGMAAELNFATEAAASPQIEQPPAPPREPVASNQSEVLSTEIGGGSKSSEVEGARVGGVAAEEDADGDASQYMNLPDIIIDIEKSNNGTTAALPPSGDIAELALNSFDVEKELDQLQYKKDVQDASAKIQLSKNESTVESTRPTAATTGVIQRANGPTELSQDLIRDGEEDGAEGVVNGSNGKASSIEKSALVSVPETLLEQVAEREQRSDEGDHNSHSNESTFEREYETFIHKIGNDDSTKNQTKTKTESAQPTTSQKIVQTQPSEFEADFEQNLQHFSKFYKRKRKLSKDLHPDPRPKEATQRNDSEGPGGSVTNEQPSEGPLLRQSVCSKSSKKRKLYSSHFSVMYTN